MKQVFPRFYCPSCKHYTCGKKSPGTCSSCKGAQLLPIPADCNDFLLTCESCSILIYQKQRCPNCSGTKVRWWCKTCNSHYAPRTEESHDHFKDNVEAADTTRKWLWKLWDMPMKNFRKTKLKRQVQQFEFESDKEYEAMNAVLEAMRCKGRKLTLTIEAESKSEIQEMLALFQKTRDLPAIASEKKSQQASMDMKPEQCKVEAVSPQPQVASVQSAPSMPQLMDHLQHQIPQQPIMQTVHHHSMVEDRKPQALHCINNIVHEVVTAREAQQQHLQLHKQQLEAEYYQQLIDFQQQQQSYHYAQQQQQQMPQQQQQQYAMVAPQQHHQVRHVDDVSLLLSESCFDDVSQFLKW